MTKYAFNRYFLHFFLIMSKNAYLFDSLSGLNRNIKKVKEKIVK